MTTVRIAVLAAAGLLSGCDTYHYVSGTLLEDVRRPVQAVRQYEKFLASRPEDPRACEVRLRSAELYRRVFVVTPRGRTVATSLRKSTKSKVGAAVHTAAFCKYKYSHGAKSAAARTLAKIQ